MLYTGDSFHGPGGSRTTGVTGRLRTGRISLRGSRCLGTRSSSLRCICGLRTCSSLGRCSGLGPCGISPCLSSCPGSR